PRRRRRRRAVRSASRLLACGGLRPAKNTACRLKAAPICTWLTMGIASHATFGIRGRLKTMGGLTMKNWRGWCVVTLLVAVCGLGSEAQAQRSIQLVGSKRTATVSVYIGKSEDVRTETSFVELTVGDPEVADVNPLTDRSLSILGKKNGTTRVSAYAEGKKLIGVFDVEVVYDTSLLQHELRRRFPYAGLRVSAVNGRIMLSGTAPDGPTVDKAVMIAKQFGPDVINSVEVLQPQQVMLEVRFVEATRTAGRDLGVQWNVFGSRQAANIGNRTTNGGGGVFSLPNGGTQGPLATVSPLALAGTLSGSAPFGVIVSKMIAAGIETDVII